MAAPSEEEMLADLEAADAAGDAELAQHIAGRIKAARAAAAPPATPETPGAARVFLHSAVRSLAPPGLEGYGQRAGIRAALGERDPVGNDVANLVRFAANPFENGPREAIPPEMVSAAQAHLNASDAAGEEAHPYAATAGAWVPAVLPLAASLLPYARTATPRVAKSPEAKLLEAQGVKGLTVGQMVDNPERSWMAALEKATDKNPLGIGAQREAAKRSWMVSEIAKSRRPGEAPLPGDVQSAFREALSRFDPEYEALGAHRVAPETVTGLPQRAVQLPGEIRPSVRQASVREIEDALGAIRQGAMQPPEPPRALPLTSRAVGVAGAENVASVPGYRNYVIQPDGRVVDVYAPPPNFTAGSSPAPRTIPGTMRPAPPPPGEAQAFRPVVETPAAPPELTTGDLIRARRHIRAVKRGAVNDPERLAALEHGEDVLTDAINVSLPSDAEAALRDADQRYATLMRAVRAAPTGHVEFTPKQLLRSSERSSGRVDFKTGEAYGQESAQAADRVFSDLPFTGGRPLAISSLPWAEKWGAPLTRVLNSEAGKRFLFDVAPVSAPSPATATVLRFAPAAAANAEARSAAPQILRFAPARLGPALRLHGVSAEDEDRP